MNPRAWVNAPSLLSTSLGRHGLGLLPLSGGAMDSETFARAPRQWRAFGSFSWCPQSAALRPQGAIRFGSPPIKRAGGQSKRPNAALTPFGMVPKRLSRGKARNPRFFEPWSCVSSYQTPGPRAPVFSHE
jgi:hypothetical protein